RPMMLPSREPGARIPLLPLTSGSNDRVTVTTEDADLCPRYAAAVADIVPAISPEWLTRRLHGPGGRPISASVDITHSVLPGLGQPTHAFDLAKLAGREIRVRRAKRGET